MQDSKKEEKKVEERVVNNEETISGLNKIHKDLIKEILIRVEIEITRKEIEEKEDMIEMETEKEVIVRAGTEIDKVVIAKVGTGTDKEVIAKEDTEIEREVIVRADIETDHIEIEGINREEIGMDETDDKIMTMIDLTKIVNSRKRDNRWSKIIDFVSLN